jgi:beta-phosphoglucomutase family hydrolase
MSLTHIKGAVFDLDGVITRTAKVHSKAWENMFNDFLKRYAERENKPFLPFDPRDDYQKYVDGMPRYEGVKTFLASRGIHPPYGSVNDPPDAETICGLGNRKNVEFQKIIREQGPEVFPTSVTFVNSLKERGIRVGVATSSRNCSVVLEMAGLLDMFETQVDGVVSADLGLKGKPDPDIFVTAAGNLGLHPSDCLVVEDAISGVQAGKAGNFGLVLGVARNTPGELLKRFGADIVVRDLSEIDVEGVDKWFSRDAEADGWRLTYDGFDPGDEKLRETLTTVGNGYMASRGSFENESASFSFYPGTYIAGIYNKPPSTVEDREILNNDLVNCPNWTRIELKIGAGNFCSPLSMELLSYRHNLDLAEGVMERSLVCKDELGRITRIHAKRIVSMQDPHLCAIQYDITPCNYQERIAIRSSIDGDVINDGVPRYRSLTSRHLEFVDGGEARDGIFLRVKTTVSGYHIVMRAKHEVFENGAPLEVRKHTFLEDANVGELMEIDAVESATYTLEKLVAVATSIDRGVWDPVEATRDELVKAKSFKSVFLPHARAWKALWGKTDIRIDGDRFIQKVTRLHIYHLLVTASPHNALIDAGMPARGLHGEAYRGHIFWDELYILPFFDLRLPKVAKALLIYRYNRLDAARNYARDNGYAGAMYPWQTADDGDEETQELHYNPESKSWGPDLSRRQRHVSIAVFYNVWRYASVTGDLRFIREYGAEIMIEVARFWADIAQKDAATGKYHIDGVMGPDEFHEKLPGAEKPGLRDNAYTNVMVVWLLEKALSLLKKLPRSALNRIKSRTGFTLTETEKWEDITKNMSVTVTPEGVISQFDGYMDLPELDWELYRKKFYSIARMDRILKAEGDSPDNYKLAKQADVLMLFYVLAPSTVKRILEQLGNTVSDELSLLRTNYDYYERRTSHGSTLSKVVHSVVSSYFTNGASEWDWFMEAMRSDIYDTQGGTTVEGVHTGVMAGTLDVIMRYFAGVECYGDTLYINPHLPKHWKLLAFKIRYKKTWYYFEFTRDALNLATDAKSERRVKVCIRGDEFTLLPGQRREVKLS